MVESRNIITTLSGEPLRLSVAKGCLQSGVHSPLLWCLVVDDLLWGLKIDGYYMERYADDIAVPINGKLHQTVSRSCRHLCVQSNTHFSSALQTLLVLNLKYLLIISFLSKVLSVS
jgi:hypothetical protein